MIKIELNKNKNHINKIVISGHALYEKYGLDIVCASISSISLTTLKAIILIDNTSISYKKSDGYLSIEVLKDSDVINKLIINMIDIFEELEQDYKKYIKITHREV